MRQLLGNGVALPHRGLLGVDVNAVAAPGAAIRFTINLAGDFLAQVRVAQDDDTEVGRQRLDVDRQFPGMPVENLLKAFRHGTRSFERPRLLPLELLHGRPIHRCDVGRRDVGKP